MNSKVAAFLAVLLIVSSTSVWFIFTAISQDSTNVTVHFIDVGQGDSILIDTSNKDVLIDAGRPSKSSIVLNYLDSLSITHIHLMIVTHVHEDHIGGLVGVLESTIIVDEILINGQSSTIGAYTDFMNLAQSHTVTVAQRGQNFILTETANLTVFNPIQPLEFTDKNANSIVVKLQVSDTSFLLTGDATADAEQSMLDDLMLDLQSDILKVGHHGSATSTTQSFLDNVSPDSAIICSGGEYGHPHEETIQKLLSKGVTTYGTYLSGTIIASTDGTTVTFPDNPEPIPELQTSLILPIFVIMTLLAVIVYQKKLR
ncbi:MAG: MBL fold metallo-hydrolase [Candidatus Bathyarchaeum sp.]|nr:MAG: MBL fold metallo-hydrolase [Candidatus Bathyarchaeum sp.]